MTDGLREVSEANQQTQQRLVEIAEQVAALAALSKKTDEQLREQRQINAEENRKTDEQLRKTGEELRKTDEELRKTVEEFREQGRRLTEEMLKSRREADRRLNFLGKQIGGLGNKFGAFTEGMAFPSLEKILTEGLGMTVVAPSIKGRLNGGSIEIDVLGYSADAVYVVEVKSHLKEEAIAKLEAKIDQLTTFFPEHRGKKIYGILAGVAIVSEAERHALRKGFYVARINGEIFEMTVPENFQPKAFSSQGAVQQID